MNLSVVKPVLVTIAAVMIGQFSTPAEARYRGTGPVCVSGVSSNDRLNIRVTPTSKGRIVGAFSPGQCGMNVESVNGNWTYLRGSDHGRRVEGWVFNKFLRARGGQSSQYFACVSGVASNDVLNIRAGRGTRFGIVGFIRPRQCGVYVTKVRGRWARVRSNGNVGWVAKKFLARR